MLSNRAVTQNQITIPDDYILSTTTNLQGIVATASDDFLKISGYSREEFVGQPHNNLRHPDVPAQVFEDMWQTIKAGKDWTGIVKNRAKNGDHYWVQANVSPMVEDGKKLGYVSVRTPATSQQIAMAEKLYRQINQGELRLQNSMAITPLAAKLNKFAITGSLAKLLAIYAMIVLLAGLVALGGLFYKSQIAPIIDQQLNEALDVAEQQIKDQIAFKAVSVTDIAATAAMMPEIQRALAGVVPRTVAEQRLSEVQNHFARITDYRNIRFQLYDNDRRSFMRSWSLEQFGDEHLDRIRDRAFETQRVVGDLSINKNGFGIGATGYAPVFYNNQLVGVVSASGGVGSIVRDLKQLNTDWVMVVDQSFYGDRMPRTLTNNNAFMPGYLLAHNAWFNEEAINYLRENLPKFEQGENRAGYFIGDAIILDLPAYNPVGEVMGRHLMIKPADQIQQQIAAATQQVIWSLLGVVLVVIAIVLLLLLVISKRVIKPLKMLSASMRTMINTGRFNGRVMYHDRGDEISDIVQSYNRFAANVQRAITNVNDVMSSVAEGKFDVQVTDILHGDLNMMKNAVNASVGSVQNTMDALQTVMDALYNGDFSVTLPDTVKGEFRTKVDQAVQNLHLTINSINHVMSKMQEGDFHYRVEVDARGELLKLKNGINSSMEDISDAITKISQVVAAQASGDLTVELPTGHFKGELHSLKNSINYSMEKMKQVVNAVTDASVNVSSAATEVSQASLDLSQRVQEQAASLEQTSATMDQMNATVQANTENAQQTVGVTQQVQKQANQGATVMQQTIGAMNSIQESSHKIADIVTLIDGIAFQTNLLALNAAVEAARAGEHGRGFAVVAGEVRALAQKSAEAAKDIKDLIDESVGRIDEGTKLAAESGDVLQGINDAINNVAEMIKQIAQASVEQSEGIKQVHNAIAQIDGVTQQNAALVEETSAASESLSEQAQRLQEDMAFFKTGNTASQPKALSKPAVLAKPAVRQLASKPAKPSKPAADEWSDF
ncbi:PAS domain-containing methyl-accepting chemotaxis protein [Thiomicrospira sp. ALE5]|uniref:methyl-accepting chemotaxis protein n=1 Tax=Thiomicrospira sp. ALE5 TaxID=748650 RepID=UPI0008E3E38A|nr:methyl-accepting chemotaxis protein [Thiomicrospira sp. ALE5]SFR52550.1 methyl-accepting chemotaxis sensory transducer with Pas/Pac sensor [Thiomicrospira sp. ALE5]